MTHINRPTTLPPEMQAVAAPDPLKTASDLSVLLVARLCHDLANPLGAIGNGVELLEMLSDTSGPELTMVSASVRQAHTRLRLFRFAFGPARPDQMTGAAEMRALLKAHDETARFWTEYAIEHDVPRSAAKMLLLGLMCLETALVWGGTVHLSSSGDGYELRALADRLRLDPALWDGVRAPGTACTPTAATIQFTLFRHHAAEQGFDVACVQDTGTLSLILRPRIRYK